MNTASSWERVHSFAYEAYSSGNGIYGKVYSKGVQAGTAFWGCRDCRAHTEPSDGTMEM